MSELRWHPFLQEWVITSTHRQDRTFFPPDDFCPLCPTKGGGFSTEIPRDTYDIAVFENRFPSLAIPAPKTTVNGCEIMPALPATGVCEVICYSPEHDATLAQLPVRQVRKLVRVWQERYQELAALKEIGYVYIFENKGAEIGVTLSHPHGQIYAYPFVPRVIQTRLRAERDHYEKRGCTLQKTWLAKETEQDERVIWRDKGWVAVAPFFARYPYEVHVAAETGYEHLGQMDANALDGLAAALKAVTQKLDKLFSFSMPYIMSIFQYPAPYSSFVVEFLPPYRSKDKLKYLAGSETGCGIFINDSLPEETAKVLRLL